MWWHKPKKTQKQRMLELLQSSGHGASARQFMDMGIFRYSSRLSNLRDEGHDIQSVQIKGSYWKYYLNKKG